jgi:hypothetical protein
MRRERVDPIRRLFTLTQRSLYGFVDLSKSIRRDGVQETHLYDVACHVIREVVCCAGRESQALIL